MPLVSTDLMTPCTWETSKVIFSHLRGQWNSVYHSLLGLYQPPLKDNEFQVKVLRNISPLYLTNNH